MEQNARHPHLVLLEAEYADFEALHALSLEQEACIDQDDLPALERSIVRMRRLMDRIRVRQKNMERGGEQAQDVCRRRRDLCDLIGQIQRLQERNQESAQRLLAAARAELRLLDSGSRAVRRYGQRTLQARGERTSRLFDDIR